MDTTSQKLIKEASALKTKKGRNESGLILVESRHPVEEALRAGLVLKRLFLRVGNPHPAPDVPRALCHTLDEPAMKRISTTDSAPPCVGVFDRPAACRELPAHARFVLLVDGLQDPGNLGTLIRSALAFGVDAVVLGPGSVDPFSPKVIRASAGLVFALPLLELGGPAISGLFGGPGWIRYVATAAEANALPYHAARFDEAPCLLVLGNEGHGVSPGLFGPAPVTPLTVPMAARVESLNVAVSGSIILAQAALQRKPHD